MKNDFEEIANELEACLPAGAALEGAKAGAVGGTISKVLKLIAALRSGDWTAVAVSVRDLLNELLGGSTDGSINFSRQVGSQAAAFSFDWKKLINVLLSKLLPLLL